MELWYEVDKQGVQWKCRRVRGPIAWMLAGRGSYIAKTRIETANVRTRVPKGGD